MRSLRARSWLRRCKRGFFFALALLFLLELWLWNHLYPLVARLVGALPWKAFKQWAARMLDTLSPAACLAVFVIPVITLFPFKLLGLWLLSQGYMCAGIGIFVLAKLVGLGVTAFLFEACKEKLLALAWCQWLYDRLLAVKLWARRQTAPAKQAILQAKTRLLGKNGRFMARLAQFRQRVKRRSGR